MTPKPSERIEKVFVEKMELSESVGVANYTALREIGKILDEQAEQIAELQNGHCPEHS